LRRVTPTKLYRRAVGGKHDTLADNEARMMSYMKYILIWIILVLSTNTYGQYYFNDPFLIKTPKDAQQIIIIKDSLPIYNYRLSYNGSIQSGMGVLEMVRSLDNTTISCNETIYLDSMKNQITKYQTSRQTRRVGGPLPGYDIESFENLNIDYIRDGELLLEKIIQYNNHNYYYYITIQYNYSNAKLTEEKITIIKGETKVILSPGEKINVPIPGTNNSDNEKESFQKDSNFMQKIVVSSMLPREVYETVYCTDTTIRSKKYYYANQYVMVEYFLDTLPVGYEKQKVNRTGLVLESELYDENRKLLMTESFKYKKQRLIERSAIHTEQFFNSGYMHSLSEYNNPTLNPITKILDKFLYEKIVLHYDRKGYLKIVEAKPRGGNMETYSLGIIK